ncbi:hypothetical protein T03_12905, partial [Trichinella britovi]
MTVATARILDPSSPNARLREDQGSEPPLCDLLTFSSSSVRSKN